MNSLKAYINEKFQVSKDNIRPYNYYPKDRDELIECIKDKIKKEGFGTKENPLNLNDIDTSKVTDISYLFDLFDGELRDLVKNGYFDISDWDVSNVTNMEYMFYGSNFNGDISYWDVSNVTNMKAMFYGSDFNGDISRWDVSNVEDMNYIFVMCPLEKNPPKWYYKE